MKKLSTVAILAALSLAAPALAQTPADVRNGRTNPVQVAAPDTNTTAKKEVTLTGKEGKMESKSTVSTTKHKHHHHHHHTSKTSSKTTSKEKIADGEKTTKTTESKKTETTTEKKESK